MRSASRAVKEQVDDACADGIGFDVDTACPQHDCSQLTVDEVGSAIAHQVTEPLTALLLYLHELKRTTASAGQSEALPAIIDSAIGEAERACAIIERISESFLWSADLELAIVRGRQAIRWLKRGGAGGHVPGDQRPAFTCLTAREREVLDLVSSGASSKEGALRLKISPRTFETHRARVMRKLRARNTAELVRMVFVGGPSA